jgi:uncharacterized protein (DUF983 family)
MFHKGSKLYSILHGVCPRCQEGKVFRFAPYRNADFSLINDHCPACNLKFVPESDFYQGAMYISYGMSTGLFVTLGAILLFYLELDYVVTFSVIMLIGIGLLPVIFQVSRLMWLNLFVATDP